MMELTAERIGHVLQTRRLGRPALVFDRVGSTNDVAHEQAHAGARDGLLVVAEEQTAGRGRLERSWWALPGTCLLMSLLFAPATVGRMLPLAWTGQLPMCLGLGTVEAIEGVTGVIARLKWPNDLVVGPRKLGGMLTELNTEGNGLNYAILGLGLNVNVDFVADDVPPDLVQTATSIKSETGRSVDRVALLAAVLRHTEDWYERVLDGESPHEHWAKRLDTLGRRVRVSFTGGSLEGVATGVTAEGGLLIRDDAGMERTIWSGDVTSLR